MSYGDRRISGTNVAREWFTPNPESSMRDDHTTPRADDSASDRTALATDELRLEPQPLKQEGDTLRDGSGSRQGQSPPNAARSEQR